MTARHLSVPFPRRSVVALAAATLFALPAVQAAPGDPVGPTVQVNVTEAGEQLSADVAQNPAGNRVVVWNDIFHVYARRAGPGGALVGPEVAVNTPAGPVTRARAAINGSGEIAVTWGGAVLESGKVYLRRFDSGGNPLGADVLVDPAGSPSQGETSVALDDDGDAVVAWTKEVGGKSAIYARRYGADGVPLGELVRVSPSTGGRHNVASVACEPDGDFTVAWTSYGAAVPVLGSGYFVLGAAGGSVSRVWMRRYTAEGTPKGPARIVGDVFLAIAGVFSSGNLASGRQISPLDLDVAVDSDGDTAVVWTENGYGFSSSRVMARRYDAAGRARLPKQVEKIPVRQGTLSYPSVSINDAGDLVVSWQESSGDHSGLYYRRYDASGTARGPSGNVPGAPTAASSATVEADGDFAIYWDDGEIRGQEFEGP